MPSVSVIIPAYNAAAFIADAIASAQAQTLADIEIIVVDDASTDNTASLVDVLCLQDTRLRLIRAAQNAGPGASRNLGLHAAQGDWIALLDADDAFLADRLARLLSIAEETDADMVSDNLLLRYENSNATVLAISHGLLPNQISLSAEAYIEGCITTSSTPGRDTFAFLKPIMRRSFLQQHAITYDPVCRTGEDFLLYVDCLLAGAKWIATPEPMYIYAVRADSSTETLSRVDQRKLIDRSRTLSRDASIRGNPALRRALHRHWANLAPIHYYYSFRDTLRARNARAAFQLLSRDRAAAWLILRVILERAVIRVRSSRTGAPSR